MIEEKQPFRNIIVIMESYIQFFYKLFTETVQYFDWCFSKCQISWKGNFETREA